MLEVREAGLYCAAGDFYIDPSRPVARALVTHAHADHACPGSQAVLVASRGEGLARERLGADTAIETVSYGEARTVGGVRVSFHPAGHILGSAQIRLERNGEVWVVSGDYKLAPDPTCEPFEPLRCHTFVTESTFGLPIFRWPAEADALEAIHQWWRANRMAGLASLLYAYPLGKSQRVLARLDGSIGPIFVHGSIERFSRIYRSEGIALPLPAQGKGSAGALILGPPEAHSGPWTKQFGAASTGMVSGWMRIRGTRRRRSLDRGFVLSDHADWPELLRAIDETRAETVWVTHGYRAPLVRWLEEHGRKAVALELHFEGGEAEERVEGES